MTPLMTPNPHMAAALALPPNAPVETRILTFWFGPEDASDRAEAKAWWFQRHDAVDAAMVSLFAKDHGDARSGRLDGLMETAQGCLALVLLLDQVPRNIFRGHAKAFAADEKARVVATHLIRQDFDRSMTEVERLFCYLPFEHSEDLVDQERSMALIGRLEGGDWLKWAEAHHRIVARFGRFPHRNAALNRESTPEEEAFLKEPGSSF